MEDHGVSGEVPLREQAHRGTTPRAERLLFAPRDDLLLGGYASILADIEPEGLPPNDLEEARQRVEARRAGPAWSPQERDEFEGKFAAFLRALLAWAWFWPIGLPILALYLGVILPCRDASMTPGEILLRFMIWLVAFPWLMLISPFIVKPFMVGYLGLVKWILGVEPLRLVPSPALPLPECANLREQVDRPRPPERNRIVLDLSAWRRSLEDPGAAAARDHQRAMGSRRGVILPRRLAPLLVPAPGMALGLAGGYGVSLVTGGAFDLLAWAMIGALLGLVVGVVILLMDHPCGKPVRPGGLSTSHYPSSPEGRVLAVVALAAVWVPGLGLFLACLSSWWNRGTDEWPKALSRRLIAASIILLAALYIWSVVREEIA